LSKECLRGRCNQQNARKSGTLHEWTNAQADHHCRNEVLGQK